MHRLKMSLCCGTLLEVRDEPTPTIVEDRKTAQVLSDLSLLPLLALFLKGERSASDVAEELGLGLDEVYYRIKKLETLGILEVAREEPRRGRPVKYYRASSSGFFVPFTLMPYETFERMMVEGEQTLVTSFVQGVARALYRSFDDLHRWGLRISLAKDGSVSASWAPRDGPEGEELLSHLLGEEYPAVFSIWQPLHLTREEAKELQRDLHALSVKWGKRSRENREAAKGGATREHLLKLGLSPEDT